MLPFDQRPWAKQLAAFVIVVSLIAAVAIPIVLHYMKALDPPVFIAIFLLLLAIIPPNIVIIRRHGKVNTEVEGTPRGPQRVAYASRTTGH